MGQQGCPGLWHLFQLLLGLSFGLAGYVRAPLQRLPAMASDATQGHDALRMSVDLARRVALRPMKSLTLTIRVERPGFARKGCQRCPAISWSPVKA